MLSCLPCCDSKTCRFLLCQPEVHRVCVGFLDDLTEEEGPPFVLFPTSWQAACLSEIMSWGISLFRNRSSSLSLGLSSTVYFAGILSLCVIKLRNEPLAEKLLVVLWVPKGLCRRQSGVWDCCWSGTPPSSWAQESACSSWGNLDFSQLCVFPYAADVLSCARIKLPLLDEFVIPAHDGCKDLEIHILLECWILLGAVGCASAACHQCRAASKIPGLENIPLFNLGAALWSLYFKVPSHVYVGPVCGLGLF